MPDSPYLSALQNIVGSKLNAFEETDRWLHQAVSEADEAIKVFSNGRVSLLLEQVSESTKGRGYNLTLRISKRASTPVGGFLVPHSGYPVLYGSYAGSSFYQAGALANGGEIGVHLLGLMSDPDSALAVALAFYLRTEEKSGGGDVTKGP